VDEANSPSSGNRCLAGSGDFFHIDIKSREHNRKASLNALLSSDGPYGMAVDLDCLHRTMVKYAS
jgi:hypothetical protein